jgi:hypothetical protein
MGALIDLATIAGYFQPECKRINLRAHAHLMTCGESDMSPMLNRCTRPVRVPDPILALFLGLLSGILLALSL